MGDFPEAISIPTAGESERRQAISAGSVFILFRVTYAALCSRKHISLTFPVQGSFWISGHDILMKFHEVWLVQTFREQAVWIRYVS